MELRVKEICKDKGVLMEELANKLGIARVNLTKTINGNPTIGTLERIATALNVPITELFSTNKQELCGHVEYKGIIYRINSFADLEKILKLRDE